MYLLFAVFGLTRGSIEWQQFSSWACIKFLSLAQLHTKAKKLRNSQSIKSDNIPTLSIFSTTSKVAFLSVSDAQLLYSTFKFQTSPKIQIQICIILIQISISLFLQSQTSLSFHGSRFFYGQNQIQSTIFLLHFF
jgi:hypothetical protein